MEFWPSPSSSSIVKRKPHKRNKGKGSSRETWSNYPIIHHGGQTAATLVKIGDQLEWRSVHSSRKGSLTALGKPYKIYPCTRPRDITNANTSLCQRAEQGTRFLRTYHPDVDIPFDLIKDELDYDDNLHKQRAMFDPFAGNLLAATYCFEGAKKKAIALAFPTGPLSCDLNISPINLKQNCVFFQPRTQPVWSFDTPICQITSSAPAVNMAEKSGYNLGIRTYGQVTVFDIQNQTTSLAEPKKTPFTISELMSVKSHEFDSGVGGSIMDMSFSCTEPAELFLITEKGAGYRCSGKGERKIINKIFDSPSEGDYSFWRITGDQTAYGGALASEKVVRGFDIRTHRVTKDLFVYDVGRSVITSICPTQIENLLCITTTSTVIWVDERFPRQPLLGWKHHRAFDRTLNAQTIEFADISLAVLGSYNNDHVSAISVGKLRDGPLQCQMPSRALPFSVCGGPVVGRTLIRHPGLPSSSFSLLELSNQGSVHHQELHYATDTSIVSSGQEQVQSRFRYTWSDEVHELERRSKDLQPEYGKLASRELTIADLTGVYEALFGEEAQTMRTEVEEAGAEGVYETLEKMPLFWQRSDIGEEHMRTLFDVAFGSSDEPLREARADFLTGTVLDSSRGYRARKQGRIPVAEVAKGAGWHMNIQPILSRISPDVFKEAPALAEQLDPYHISREVEIPEADRRESEAREQLALDLALATDVFSATPIKNPTHNQPASGEEGIGAGSNEDAVLLTQAAEKLSLTGKEPLQVNFGFLRPVLKNGKKHYRHTEQGEEVQVGDAEGEGEETVKMPLGVRLLLSEWTVGDDPYKYEYVDPYDLEGTGAEAQLAKRQTQRQVRRHRQQRSPSEDRDDGSLHPAQSQAPPTIVAARSLAAQGKPAAGKVPQVASSRAIIHEQHRSGMSQVEPELAPRSHPTIIANTQVLPGRFGGRQTAGKKKSAAKRLGGF